MRLFTCAMAIVLAAGAIVPATATPSSDTSSSDQTSSSSSQSSSSGNKAAAAGIFIGLMQAAQRQKEAEQAKPQGDSVIPTVRRIHGDVRVQLSPGGPWQILRAGDRLPAGALLRTGRGSSLEAAFLTGGFFTLLENASFEMRQASAAGYYFVLNRGKLANRYVAAPGRSYIIRTASGEIRVTGTQFDVEVDEKGRTVTRVYEGSVALNSPQSNGDVVVRAGEEAVVAADGTVSPPSRMKIIPPSPFGLRAMWVVPGAASTVSGATGTLLDPDRVASSDVVLRTRGELTMTDPKRANGTFFDRHVIEVQGGDALTVQLTAGTLDPYLIVTLPGGETFENDNGAPRTYTAQVSVRAGRSGTMEIVTTTPNSPRTGPYKLFVAREKTAEPAPSAKTESPYVRLIWEPSPLAIRYRVHVRVNDEWQALADVDRLDAAVTELARGEEHLLSVTSVGSEGESAAGENTVTLLP